MIPLHNKGIIMRATRIGGAEKRLMDRIDVDVVTGCWNWNGYKNTRGYGIIAGTINGKRYAPVGANMLAHRVSWIVHRGDIPDGEGAHGTVVMHTCDNPSCINPDHLKLGTQADNVADMIEKGRKPPRKVKYGIEHHRSVITNQADIDLICSTHGNSKALAEKLGISVSTIKKIRRKNGVGVANAEKFHSKQLSQEAIDHIRSTPPRAYGLAKLYGVSNVTISRIRNGTTYTK